MLNPADKYLKAYEGILTSADLEKAAHEAAEFEADLKKPGKMPRWFVREVLGRLPDDMKEKAVEKGLEAANREGRDYSDVAARLNGHQFVLERHDNGLRQILNSQKISRRFAPGEEFRWPTLVLVANSNLVSPQSFYDSFESARAVADNILHKPLTRTLVAGTYFSQRNLNANALDTIRRYRELGLRPHSLDGISPAAEVQAYQLLDLLLDRDHRGRVLCQETEGGLRPILRMDAKAVMSHVVCYGYSAAHMTNKDAFRALRDLLLKGDVLVQLPGIEEPTVKTASLKYVHELLGNASIIGLGGMDNMLTGTNRMPREVNFIHRGDLSNALNGPKYLKAPGIVLIKAADGSNKPLEARHGGHDQKAYVEALLSPANQRARESAASTLGGYYRMLG